MTVNFSFFHTACTVWKYVTEIYSHAFFGKNFVKVTHILNKSLKITFPQTYNMDRCSFFFCKNFVKVMALLTKLLNGWFDEISWNLLSSPAQCQRTETNYVENFSFFSTSLSLYCKHYIVSFDSLCCEWEVTTTFLFDICVKRSWILGTNQFGRKLILLTFRILAFTPSKRGKRRIHFWCVLCNL